jgi:hypothetical protein
MSTVVFWYVLPFDVFFINGGGYERTIGITVISSRFCNGALPRYHSNTRLARHCETTEGFNTSFRHGTKEADNLSSSPLHV